MAKNFLKNLHKTTKIHIIYGLHSVEAALLNNKRVHNELIIHENQRDLIEKYKSKIKKIRILDHKEFKKIYGTEQSTQGIVLKTKDYNRPTIDEFLINEKAQLKSVIIVLDQITDPQNIGSIMRSCALFKCKAVITSKDNAPDLTPSLLKAASGALELVNYYKVTNLRRTINSFKRFQKTD